MAKQSQASEVRQFVIQNVTAHPGQIARIAAEHFGLTTQTVNHHLRGMVAEGVLRSSGNTRARRYELVARRVEKHFEISERPQEDVVWREFVEPQLADVSRNVMDICHYGLTEMVNNAVDHSEGTSLTVTLVRTAASVEFWIHDDGIGIFEKIRRALSLPDAQDAVLELAKGKFTTDPRRHTGEGIFFSSRAFDRFAILSGPVFFRHVPDDSDWVAERASEQRGTLVQMSIDLASTRVLRELFDQFAAPEEYTFSITHVPVALVRHGEENLVSRSQGKRLVRGFERFEQVVLDFADVNEIGQAFADEVFRVFQLANPGVELQWVNAGPDVERMIRRARANLT